MTTVRKKLNRENIDRWFEYNIFEDTRTIYMGSASMDWEGHENGVDNWMAEYFTKAMHILESSSPDKEITIIMNNPGGDWYHGMAIYDAIDTSPCKVTIKVHGYAMSMGSIILQSADRRIMMPNSRFMIHYGYNGQSNHTKIFERWADEGKRINFDMEEIYLSKMLIKSELVGREKLIESINDIREKLKEMEYKPVKNMKDRKYKFSNNPEDFKEDLRLVLREFLEFDTILTPFETVDLGFADEVVGYDTDN